MARACSFDAAQPDLKQELYLLLGNNVESNHYLDKPCQIDQTGKTTYRSWHMATNGMLPLWSAGHLIA